MGAEERAEGFSAEPGRSRKIIHIDMDAFYASVEQRDNPELRGKRVGLIGTGSSGIQVAPIIAAQAESMVVFQRAANYTIPMPNRPWSAEEQRQIQEQYPARRRASAYAAAGRIVGSVWSCGRAAAFDIRLWNSLSARCATASAWPSRWGSSSRSSAIRTSATSSTSTSTSAASRAASSSRWPFMPSSG